MAEHLRKAGSVKSIAKAAAARANGAKGGRPQQQTNCVGDLHCAFGKVSGNGDGTDLSGLTGQRDFMHKINHLSLVVVLAVTLLNPASAQHSNSGAAKTTHTFCRGSRT